MFAAIPSPPKDILLGHLRQLKKDPARFMIKAAEFGDVSKISVLGKNVILLNHPDFIKQILQAEHQKFIKSPGYKPLRYLGGMGIFTSDGEQWLKQRKMYQPSLNYDSINKYVQNVEIATDQLIEEWTGLLKKSDTSIAVKQSISNLTLSILSKSLFSQEIKSDKLTYEAITKAMEWIGNRVLSQPFNVPYSWPFPSNIAFRKAVKTLDDLIFGIINERKKSQNHEDDLLSNFMKYSDSANSFSAKELRDEIMTIFIAGHESSANVLNWAIYELGKNPKIQAKVREEAKSILHESMSLTSVYELKYTKQVIDETMRLYPPIWHIGRQNIEIVKIGQYTFNPGTHFRVSPFVLQRDVRFWEAANVFDPNRFSAERKEYITAFSYFPFGAGPRLCAGKNFAMMEMMVIIAKLVTRFEWTCVNNNVEILPVMTLRPKQEIELKLNCL